MDHIGKDYALLMWSFLFSGKEGDRMEHKDDVLMDGNYQRKIQMERRGQIYGNK